MKVALFLSSLAAISARPTGGMLAGLANAAMGTVGNVAMDAMGSVNNLSHGLMKTTDNVVNDVLGSVDTVAGGLMGTVDSISTTLLGTGKASSAPGTTSGMNGMMNNGMATGMNGMMNNGMATGMNGMMSNGMNGMKSSGTTTESVNTGVIDSGMSNRDATNVQTVSKEPATDVTESVRATCRTSASSSGTSSVSVTTN